MKYLTGLFSALLFSGNLFAANLCDSSCDLSITFPDGGSIEAMKLLLGRFVTKRRKYGTYINRNERNEDFIEPISTNYQGRIVLLIDEMSISGAENMAGIIQYFKIENSIGHYSCSNVKV